MSVSLWLWTHISTCVVLGCLTYIGTSWLTKRWRFVLSFVAAGAAFLPVRGTNLTGLILGHAEIFSVSTVAALLFSTAIKRNIERGKKSSTTSRPEWNRQQVTVASGLFLLCGVILYTSTFGFTAVDVYAAGYYPEFDWTILTLSVIFAAKRCWLPAYCLVASVIAHEFRLTDSANLWNYLLDPWIVLASAGQVSVIAWQVFAARSNDDELLTEDDASVSFPAEGTQPVKAPPRRAA